MSDPNTVILSAKRPSWQRQMRDAIRTVVELCDHLGLDAAEHASLDAATSFSVFAPHPFVSRMQHGDAADPLLRQVLPVAAEMQQVEGYVVDPLGEQQVSRQPGLLQKYDRRVLLVTTGACAIHCRYCFRRHFPYGELPNSMHHWQPLINDIADDESIDEVILSGGDPLTIVDESLGDLLHAIEGIKHVARVRFHTRLPIMIPDRVTSRLLHLLSETRLQPVFVLHINHVSEIDDDVAAAVDRLRKVGVPLLNQSVLLRGVNNSTDSMEKLCRRLVDIGVMPYYMHQLDRVAGAAHFAVEKRVGIEIVEELRARLPGYAVPMFVEEQFGDASKRPIF